MDFSSKRCNTLQDSSLVVLDRLSSLPVDLLIRILSMLPTKDVAATSTLSTRIRRAFPWVTTLYLSDSPISNCLQHPYATQRFPVFVSFVDTVLHSHRSQYLTTFKLQLGMDFIDTYYTISKHRPQGCVQGCFPDLKSTQINAWISFAITRIGLKELHLRIRIREPGELPPAIFMCETLEVLKIDVNLGLDQASTMPSFRLPNLKLLHLFGTVINDHGFLPRLISSCPLLEDLRVEVFWNHGFTLNISSLSLRRLSLVVLHLDDTRRNTDFLHIDTPNLEYLHYAGKLPAQHSITNMDHLVEAQLIIRDITGLMDNSLPLMLSLIKVFNNVQYLSLQGIWTEEFEACCVEDKLPMFDNLKYLELGYYGNSWNNVVLAFLNHSPVLETLVFPAGLKNCCIGCRLNEGEPCICKGTLAEQEFFKKTLAVIPSCCRSHLKRIEIDDYYGRELEVNLIQFLLRHAFVLEQLILSKGYQRVSVANEMTLASALQNLPRASATCSFEFRIRKQPRKRYSLWWRAGC